MQKSLIESTVTSLAHIGSLEKGEQSQARFFWPVLSVLPTNLESFPHVYYGFQHKQEHTITKMSHIKATWFPLRVFDEIFLHFFGPALKVWGYTILLAYTLRHYHYICLRSIDSTSSWMQRLGFGVQKICPRISSGQKHTLDRCLGLKIQAIISKAIDDSYNEVAFTWCGTNMLNGVGRMHNFPGLSI